jgi:hypothetical protein
MPQKPKSNQQTNPLAEQDPGALDEADRRMLLREDGEQAEPGKELSPAGKQKAGHPNEGARPSF